MEELFDALSAISKILLLVIIAIFLYIKFDSIYKMLREDYLYIFLISIPLLWFYINMGFTPYWIQRKIDMEDSKKIQQKLKVLGLDK